LVLILKINHRQKIKSKTKTKAVKQKNLLRLWLLAGQNKTFIVTLCTYKLGRQDRDVTRKLAMR
jgi:hypothetical protein